MCQISLEYKVLRVLRISESKEINNKNRAKFDKKWLYVDSCSSTHRDCGILIKL
jgi:hypothetical protein